MNKKLVILGMQGMLPIITGVIPFGLVMGTVASNAGLSMAQTMGMNIIVFAGASQLAAVDLMLQNAPAIIVILAGVTINLRFLLYSAALSSSFEKAQLKSKAFASYALTDQTYTVLIANESHYNNLNEKISFYFGSAIPMILAWQISVLLGFIFGNFAPSSLSLDYAVPLSFVALVLPTLKNKSFYIVATVSAMLSILLQGIPHNLGLLITALLSITLGAFLSQNKQGVQND